MPIQNKPPNPKPTSRTSADVIHYGKVFRPYGKEWVENGLTSHVPIPTIIELIHQNIPAKRNTDLTSLKKTALVSILMKFYDKTNNTGKKRIEQWVYTHRYRRKIQFENPFVEKINKFLNHLKTFESPKFTVTPATASKIFNELTITGITSLSEVRSVLKSNIVKSSSQEKAFNPIFNEWFSSDLSKYTNSPSRVKIIPDSLSALDPSSSQSSESSQSSDDIESLLTEFRQIVSGAGNSEGEYIPNEASNEHTESPEISQDPNDTDDFEEDLEDEDEAPEPPEKLEPKSDTSPSSLDSDKEDDSDETSEEDETVSDSDSQSDLPEDLDEEPSEKDEKDEQDSKSELDPDSSENDEDPDEKPEADEPEEPEDDSGETSDSSDETEPEDEPPQNETSNSNSETDGDSSEEKDESEEDSSDEKEENNDGEDESEEETESDKDEEPQQDGDSDSTTEPLRERPLVKEQVKDMILKIANSEDSTIDELRHHTKEQLNIT